MPKPARAPSPAVRRRRLAAELARLREADGRAATEIAEALGWSHSKITRFEGATGSGLTLPKIREIGRLWDEYARAAHERGDGDAFTPDRRRQVLALAADCRLRGWWSDYPELAAGQATLIGLEAEAAALRTFEPNIVPTLLQTAAYLRALLTGRFPGLHNAETVDRIIEAETRRGQMLHHAQPLQIRAVIAEPAIHWQIGGRRVLTDQLKHLMAVSDMPNVDVRLLPFTAGAHRGFGTFGVVTFTEPLDPEIAYERGPGGATSMVEDRSAVEAYGTAFGSLVLQALPAGATRDRIREAARML